MAAWHEGESGLSLALRRFLGRFEVRLFLSVCIVISLLPLAEVRRLDVVFLVVFGVEFLLRAGLVLRDEDDDDGGWRWPQRSTLLLLLFDLLALVSFLPLVAHDTPWMRLLRVIRLIALLSYWAPVMHDLRSVLLRRERSRQVLVMGVMVGLLSFVGALVLEQIEAGSGVVDYDEDGQVTSHDSKFFVHLWWAFRQIQDPGNMLAAPSAPGAVVVSIILTVFGLLLVSFLIGLGTDVVREVMTVSHLRSPGLAGHTVIVHVNASTGHLLEELVRYYQKLLPEGSTSRRWIRQLADNWRRVLFGPRYVVVGRGEERPAFLRRPALQRIVYRSARAAHPDFMQRADVARAQRVVVLADLEAQNPDAETIHALLMIHDALRPATKVRRPIAARRATDGHHTEAPERLLIAEIFDERNLPAAWAAIDRGAGGAAREPGVGPATEGLRTFVIPIERLIGLLLACVARIDGVGPVLEELLASHGHEIYTCFFPEAEQGAGSRLTGSYAAAMTGLRARAFARPPRRFLTPIGLLYEHTDAQGARSRRMAIGAGGCAELGEPTWTGMVAVAPNFAVLRDLCDDLQRPAGAAAVFDMGELAGCPEFDAQPQLPLRRILVCGFRPATVGLLEALVLAEPQAQILVLLDDEATLATAAERFREHRSLAEYRTLSLSPGSFIAQDDGSFVYQPRLQQELRCGRVHLAVGDRSSLLQFVDLPAGFGHAGDLDLALLLATRREDGDARTTQSLLALEVARNRGGRRSSLRVVAEVVEAELCARLRRRACLRGDDHVLVYALENLRAAFLFQSVLIPAFNLVYGELMGPWGQSFTRKRVRAAGFGTCSFQALALRFVAAGEVLIAVERRRADGEVVLDLAGGDGNGGRVDLATLVAVWVLLPDPAEIHRGSCVDGPVA